MLEETPSAEKSGIAEASPRQVLDALAFAEKAARDLVRSGSATLRPRLMRDGKVIQELIDANQHATHALAWIATYAEALGQMRGWGMRLAEDGRMGEVETLILLVGAGEYLAQLTGGIPMSQGEMARPRDLGLEEHALAAFRHEAVRGLISGGSSPEVRARLAALLPQRQGYPTVGATGLDDELEMIRGQFRRFTDERVSPYAQQWHRDNALIPMAVISEMAEMGVFGLTIPEQFGGLGMSKAAMCVVSEELSRGYIGVGSLGTRSEIAAELILCGGTEEQKNRWLPLIASGEVLPTAVFTEPNVGSDLGSLRTRAHKKGDAWLVTGSKTWITHAARANLMTLLARTDPNSQDYRGLSMFLAESIPVPRTSRSRKRGSMAAKSRFSAIAACGNMNSVSMATKSARTACSVEKSARVSSS